MNFSNSPHYQDCSSWHQLFHFLLSFRIWNVWNTRENNRKRFFNEIKTIFYSFWRAIIWCPLESRNYGKQRKKFQKSFFNEIKVIFDSFWRAITWWKNKNLIKRVDTSFKNILTKTDPGKWQKFSQFTKQLISNFEFWI